MRIKNLKNNLRINLNCSLSFVFFGEFAPELAFCFIAWTKNEFTNWI